MSENKRVVAAMSAKAKKDLDELTSKLGLTQKEAFGRLLDWFVDQEDLLQTVVLRQIRGEEASDVIDLLFARAHGMPRHALFQPILAWMIDTHAREAKAKRGRTKKNREKG